MKSLFGFLAILLISSINAQTVNVTFQVDASNISVNPNGISVAGSFQNWAPENGEMTEIGNGIWERSFQIASNSNIQFKFINGNSWENQIEQVPTECGISDGFGGFNRALSVGSNDVVFGPVCFSSCSSCAPQELVNVSFQVDMSNEVVSPEGVYVAGSFQDWNPAGSELQPIGNGLYEGTFAIPANANYYFKFINGNDWPGQETVPGDCGMDDGFGGFNRFLEVNSQDATYGPVCFESCFDCDESVPVLVTFSVDLTDETINEEGVFVAGSFNDFNPAEVQMSPVGNGIFQAVLVLNPGTIVEYKFLNGPDFSGQEIVPAECGTDDGFGSFNRTLQVGATPQVLEIVCFSSCAACPTAESYSVTLSVNMADETVHPDGVFVAGSFNDFNPAETAMTETSPGIFEMTIDAAAGQTLTYKFLNGPSFDFVEDVPSDCGQPDGFGGYNRASFVSSDLIIETVCFSSCADCLTSVNEQAINPIRLFPNPANDVVFLSLNENQPTQMLMYSAEGKLIQTIGLNPGELFRLDVSEFNPGLYVLKSTTGNHSIRLLVE